ncbi:MAG: hypothetical protein Q4F33_01800 [Mycoplasmatota bacterium]|nr:hypothetical protein [Mycoplasmatota bacterium]
MYAVKREKNSGEILEWNPFSYFLMSSRKGFSINGEIIKVINVVDKKLAIGPATKKVMNMYSKLVPLLTELIVSDDASGDSFREALNHIEKFRLEIKIKYREYLKRKELELMSKQLSTLKKEAEKRLLEIREEMIVSRMSGKGK